MIFVKNAQIGKVKTRLAASIGDEAALDIYIKLLKHTAAVAQKTDADKAVFYSSFIEENDEFNPYDFYKYLQSGEDLGKKMANAFIKAFARKYENVIIIGSDCLDLDENILQEAFIKLEHYDVVIGPALDGGYYLLGMKKYHPSFFENKQWSTNNVCIDTILDCKNHHLKYFLLKAISDVDVESDVNFEKLNKIK
jgi:rSAM/selenodomain-associated transferase 1